MKRKYLILGILAFTLVFQLSCSAKKRKGIDLKGARLGVWTMDYDAALKAAKKHDKPIFLQFTGSDWCPWCKLMAKNVFATKEWKKYAKKRLYLVYLDFPRYDLSLVPERYRERNNLLTQKYGVRGFPTYIILDSDGVTELGRLGAGRDKTGKSFVKEVERVVRMRPSEYKKFLKSLPKSKQNELKNAMDARERVINELQAWLETRPQRTEENINKYNKFMKKLERLEKKIDAIFENNKK